MRRVANFLVGALLAVVTAELAVRQTNFTPWITDPVFGYVMRPFSAVRFATEGSGTSHWIEHGIRRAAAPSAGAPAILALGDSFTEALMVDDDEVFSQRLETLLAADGSPFAVLNLGRSGASAADYLALAGRYRELFAPRWTVIQLKDGDLGEPAWNGAGQARMTRAADGRVTASFELKRPSAAGRLAQRLSAWITLPNYGAGRLRAFIDAYGQEPPLFRATAAGVKPEAKAVDDYPVEETLESLRDAYDGRVTFLFLSEYDPKEPTALGSRTEQRLIALCRERAWSCVSLRDSFPSFSARHEAPYGFSNTVWNRGHLNAEGHRAAAELLHAEMKRLSASDLL